MSILSEEIYLDPMKLGYDNCIKSGSDNQILSLLNSKRFDRVGSVDIAHALIWMAKHRMLSALEYAAAQDTDIRDIAKVTLLLAQNASISRIDFAIPEVHQMLEALVYYGIIPKEAHEELLSMATTKTSRAEQLFGRSVTLDEVSEARANGIN